MSKEHKAAALSVINTLNESGYIAYFAGGFVRDLLMKIPSDDIDIATSASTEDIQNIFPKTVPVGISFGVVIVIVDGHEFEVATFRSDRAYVDGRRPIGIDPASPEEDSTRRDFTINGMFYDPLKEQLLDFVGGKQDIEKGIIRAIGDPFKRFEEDRLRMIRAVRYSARFHFIIEEETIKAISSLAPKLLESVAVERIWQEFEKMHKYPHFDTALLTMQRLGLLHLIFPKLSKISQDELKTRLRPLESLATTIPMPLALFYLFPNSSLEEKHALCDFFKVSNKVRELLSFYHKIENVKPLYIETKLDDYEWSMLYSSQYFDVCFEALSHYFIPEEQSKLYEYHKMQKKRLSSSIDRIQRGERLLKASELEKVGIKPGPLMGQLLKSGERLSINEKLEDPEEIIERLKQSPDWPSS